MGRRWSSSSMPSALPIRGGRRRRRQAHPDRSVSAHRSRHLAGHRGVAAQRARQDQHRGCAIGHRAGAAAVLTGECRALSCSIRAPGRWRRRQSSRARDCEPAANCALAGYPDHERLGYSGSIIGASLARHLRARPQRSSPPSIRRSMMRSIRPCFVSVWNFLA